MELAERAATLGNFNAITDAASAAAMGRAALSAAGYNVRINAASLKSEPTRKSLLEELRALENRAIEIEARMRAVLEERAGI
jgi:glutamate formiminotransferase/formiminotetrahydrofolate cyclodeaminase